MSTIHVTREGTLLGIFSPEEIKTGLENGQFFLSDSAWKSGMERWTPLQEWPEFATQNDAPPVLTAPVSDKSTVPEPAWERRKAIGTWKAFEQTVRGVLLTPTKVFSGLSPERGLWNPLSFFLIALLIYAALKCFVGSLFNVSLTASLLLEDSFIHKSLVDKLLEHIFNSLISVCAAVLYVSYVTGINHLLLRVFYDVKRTFPTTVKTNAYIFGSLCIFLWVPLLNYSLLVMWGMGLQIIALSRVHEISIGKTSLIVALQVVPCCVSVMAGGMR
jgi:hypothetical protein